MQKEQARKVPSTPATKEGLAEQGTPLLPLLASSEKGINKVERGGVGAPIHVASTGSNDEIALEEPMGQGITGYVPLRQAPLRHSDHSSWDVIVTL